MYIYSSHLFFFFLALEGYILGIGATALLNTFNAREPQKIRTLRPKINLGTRAFGFYGRTWLAYCRLHPVAIVCQKIIITKKQRSRHKIAARNTPDVALWYGHYRSIARERNHKFDGIFFVHVIWLSFRSACFNGTISVGTILGFCSALPLAVTPKSQLRCLFVSEVGSLPALILRLMSLVSAVRPYYSLCYLTRTK